MLRFFAPAAGIKIEEALPSIFDALTRFETFVDESADPVRSHGSYRAELDHLEAAMETIYIGRSQGTDEELKFSEAYGELGLALFVASSVFEALVHCISAQNLVAHKDIYNDVLPDKGPLKTSQDALLAPVKTAFERLKPYLADALRTLAVLVPSGE